jgi:hypothetical protein
VELLANVSVDVQGLLCGRVHGNQADLMKFGLPDDQTVFRPMRDGGNGLVKLWATGILRRQEPQISPQRRDYCTDTGARASLRFLNDNAADKTCIVCRGIVAKRQQQPSQNVAPKFDCPLGEASMVPQPFRKFDGSRLHGRTAAGGADAGMTPFSARK